MIRPRWQIVKWCVSIRHHKGFTIARSTALFIRFRVNESDGWFESIVYTVFGFFVQNILICFVGSEKLSTRFAYIVQYTHISVSVCVCTDETMHLCGIAHADVAWMQQWKCLFGNRHSASWAMETTQPTTNCWMHKKKLPMRCVHKRTSRNWARTIQLNKSIGGDLPYNAHSRTHTHTHCFLLY